MRNFLVFRQLQPPSTPVFTEEIAESLECPQQTVRHSLADLADRGEIQTKQRNDSSRIWWKSDRDLSSGQQPDEDQFRAFVSAVKDYAIFMLDPDGRVASWNQDAERIKGYSEEEIVGEHFSTFYTEDAVADGVPELGPRLPEQPARNTRRTKPIVAIVFLDATWFTTVDSWWVG
jgi:PAS domain-containing protein